jgi:protein-disulfide isomerase
MKKLVSFSSMILLLGLGCQKKDTQVTEQIAKLEQRVEQMEKRLTQAPPMKPPAPQAEEQTSAYDLPIGESYVWGNPKAPVTLTKFSDAQCPFCARAHESFVEELMKDKELEGKVKVVFKHFPLSFHKNAKPASKAALAAGEQSSDCFWKMTKALYTGQKDLSEENFQKWAKEVKCENKKGTVGPLDAKKFWKDYKNNDAKYEAMIQADMDLGMKAANVRGTPSFFLNGWKLSQRSVEAVKQMIKEKGLDKAGQNG